LASTISVGVDTVEVARSITEYLGEASICRYWAVRHSINVQVDTSRTFVVYVELVPITIIFPRQRGGGDSRSENELQEDTKHGLAIENKYSENDRIVFISQRSERSICAYG
jgi:hypothetical protein